MRIDRINVDLFVAVPDMYDHLGLTTEQAASSIRDALLVTLGGALPGIAVQTAETLTEDEWQAAQVMLAQGCGHCEGCKERAEAEAEWAEANGFTV
jgi:7-cyano-7-deazaguanine synthase in queuosine biosynthesis